MCAVTALGVSLSPALTSSAGAAGGTCPGVAPDTGQPVDAALNACLQAGGTTALEPGTYIIDSGLTIAASGTTLTSTTPGGPTQPVLQAGPDLAQPILDAPAPTNWINVSVTYVTFDGARASRLGGNPYQSLCSAGGDRQLAENVRFHSGVGFQFEHNVSENALCGSGLQVDAVNFTISGNQFLNDGAGQHPAASSGPLSYADGITLGFCSGGIVDHNTIVNATDIGVVSFGGTNCQITNNSISQTDTAVAEHAFAGIALHTPGDNDTVDDTGSVVTGNTVSGNNNMGFGISYGPRPWFPSSTVRGGSVSSNTVSGAIADLAVEGVSAGSVGTNSLSSPGGSPLCPTSGGSSPTQYNLNPLDSSVTTSMLPTTTRNYTGCRP